MPENVHDFALGLSSMKSYVDLHILWKDKKSLDEVWDKQ